MTVTPASSPPPRHAERAHRLTGIGTFDALFRAGRRRQGRWIELVVAPAARSPGRTGLVVGRKVLPRAVDRNRFKRKLRESLRRARPAIEAFDLIVRLKRAAPGSELAAAVEEAEGMIALVCSTSPPPAPEL
ncbi:MAG TPA: ribonuclease P protein component [Casimicrobiaceae bacterium]|nr:ribonuclease P protein component [Casimicrobiaceae bacterium]